MKFKSLGAGYSLVLCYYLCDRAYSMCKNVTKSEPNHANHDYYFKSTDNWKIKISYF